MFEKKNQNKYCPLIKKPCVGSECMWAVTVAGSNPQTGEPVNEEACAITWLPILAIEQTKNLNGVQASIESLRNEVVTPRIVRVGDNLIEKT